MTINPLSENLVMSSGAILVLDPASCSKTNVFQYNASGTNLSIVSGNTIWNEGAPSQDWTVYGDMKRTVAASMRISYTGSTLNDEGVVYMVSGLNLDESAKISVLADAIRDHPETVILPVKALKTGVLLNATKQSTIAADFYAHSVSSTVIGYPSWIDMSDNAPAELSPVAGWNKVFFMAEGMDSTATLAIEAVTHLEVRPGPTHYSLASPVRTKGGHHTVHSWYNGLDDVVKSMGRGITHALGDVAGGATRALGYAASQAAFRGAYSALPALLG